MIGIFLDGLQKLHEITYLDLSADRYLNDLTASNCNESSKPVKKHHVLVDR